MGPQSRIVIPWQQAGLLWKGDHVWATHANKSGPSTDMGEMDEREFRESDEDVGQLNKRGDGTRDGNVHRR